MSPKNLRSFFQVTCVLLGFLLVFSSSVATASTRRLVFADSQWDSQMILNQIAKFIVENGFDGNTVEFSTASSALNWRSIIRGDVDLEIEIWPDNVHTFNDDVAQGDIVPLGVVVPDSAQGIYTPRYVIEGCPERGIEPMAPTLRHVRDLARYAHVFRDPEDPSMGRFHAPIPGWAFISGIMYNKYRHYNLNAGYNFFRVGSEAVLFASLLSAYNLEEPWVGYLWEPSWIVGMLDLVMLEDEPFDPDLLLSGACAIPNQALLIASSRYFPEKAPDLLDFFRNFKVSTELISGALARLEETRESHLRIAMWLMRQNDHLLDEWLTPEQAQRVREALPRD